MDTPRHRRKRRHDEQLFCIPPRDGAWRDEDGKHVANHHVKVAVWELRFLKSLNGDAGFLVELLLRKYIAQRAELLGAVRLPDNTFRANAGTEVTSDILIVIQHFQRA